MSGIAKTSVRVVLVDTSPPGSMGSMSRYARLVEQALKGQADRIFAIEVVVIHPGLTASHVSWLPGAAQVWINHFWIMLSGRACIMRAQPDLVHILDGSYGYMALAVSDVPVIATVHDLIPLLQQKGRFGADSTSFLARRLVRRAVMGLCRCTALIADSENSRRDAVNSAGVEAKKISVIPVALDTAYLDLIDATGVAVRSDGEDAGAEGGPPMILHVGNNGDYKNREGVLRIFSKVTKRQDAHLVMAGAAPTARLLRMVDDLKLQDFVQFMTDLDDQALSGLYQKAALLLFPSIYEGFGWPPLEAMACGCPVVCSTAASLPEVVGDAALCAAVDDEDELARLCGLVLNDRNLAQSLIVRGRQRASQFTIERMGKQLVDVYRQVIGPLCARFLSAATMTQEDQKGLPK